MDLTIYHLQFNNIAKFKAYLKSGQLQSEELKLAADDAAALLNNAIDGLFG